jgi:hypothetical protein
MGAAFGAKVFFCVFGSRTPATEPRENTPGISPSQK